MHGFHHSIDPNRTSMHLVCFFGGFSLGGVVGHEKYGFSVNSISLT